MAILNRGNNLGIVSPSRPLSFLSDELKRKAENQIEDMGLETIFADNSLLKNDYTAGSVSQRVKDIHSMFKDKEINAIISSAGGYNSNQLLNQIDWNIIRNNPKPFIGYSDITVLLNAIYKKTGITTFHGPMFSDFCQEQKPREETLDFFKKLFFEEKDEITITASEQWSEDKWYKNPDKRRNLKKNKGHRVIQKGSAEGTLIGGNLSSLLLLVGTAYLPNFENKILLIEEDEDETPATLDRMLTHLQVADLLEKIEGVLIGRLPTKIGFSNFNEIKHFFRKFFKNIPITYGLDFGHTDPKITLPIGGRCKIKNKQVSIDMTKEKDLFS